ncbi:hypothetical protein MPDQ_001220 [Monascus purpureus]|uniref:Transferase n=1 Tax=Monascus purpureus TaxID=5098 RepID=A0A507R4A4_MONPU|nr:hypothetical protein MPDQ_001220 [Monascus purpureus]
MVAGQSTRETTRLFSSQPLGTETSVSPSILDANCRQFFSNRSDLGLRFCPRRNIDRGLCETPSDLLRGNRFNRPIIRYGTDTDPGVEWAVVYHDFPVESLAPCPEERASGSAFWIGDDFPQNALISQTPLAWHNLRYYKGLPGMLVQINFFSTGGYAIGVKIAHSLADAQALMVFIPEWMMGGSTLRCIWRKRR